MKPLHRLLRFLSYLWQVKMENTRNHSKKETAKCSWLSPLTLPAVYLHKSWGETEPRETEFMGIKKKNNQPGLIFFFFLTNVYLNAIRDSWSSYEDHWAIFPAMEIFQQPAIYWFFFSCISSPCLMDSKALYKILQVGKSGICCFCRCCCDFPVKMTMFH